MNRHKNFLIHWIAAFAIAMSALAPVISQAASLAQHGQGFTMEICSADSNKTPIEVRADQQAQEGTQNSGMQSCPDCVAQSLITPIFNTSLTFQAPQSFAFLPQLFYQSPQPMSVWLSPPAAAPPTKA
ncbi:DUF2946 domain-containing protein [Polynucleobacter antarcticus]|uniref:DUF2946 domain-containing protein n=1 Tax=Polynucleobacter antarcticus TaxID=1743162 RepID=A0A6M9PIS9_9BURK|nr:DUF2946 domain-containing protein [Polynucleobacter antarcticus]QKM62054.1 hypothetical protein DCO16_02550 [Polynucleobacter antarcticus]